MSKFSRRVRRAKLPLVGLALLAAATAVVVTYALGGGPLSSVASPTATPKQTAAVVPDKVVAFLGDSYTSGSGANPGGGYAMLLSRDMGWEVRLFGQGGTGYTNAGQPADNETVFGGRVPDVIAAKPDIVIVQGSTNDYEAAPVEAAAAKVFADLRTSLPNAKIIAVGPLAAPAGDPKLVRASSSGVAAAAVEHGVSFIDPITAGWMTDASLYPDGLHPSQEGHRMMANLLRQALAPLGITPKA